jgi:hypothetical protein
LGKYALVALDYGNDFRLGVRGFYYSGVSRDFSAFIETKKIKKAVNVTASVASKFIYVTKL